MGFLKDFLFSPEQAKTPISVLSGGAAASVALWNCADRRPSGAVAYVPANSRVTVTVGMNTRGGALCMASTSPVRVLVDLAAAG